MLALALLLGERHSPLGNIQWITKIMRNDTGKLFQPFILLVNITLVRCLVSNVSEVYGNATF